MREAQRARGEKTHYDGRWRPAPGKVLPPVPEGVKPVVRFANPLQGVVSWFDNFCVLLRRDGQSQLVYKHAISTIMPAQPVQLYEPGPEQDD